MWRSAPDGNISSIKSDKKANYVDVREYDLTGMEPQIACPHLPENVKPVSQLAAINIDQSVVGSCTNGRIEDMREAARVIKGHEGSSLCPHDRDPGHPGDL